MALMIYSLRWSTRLIIGTSFIPKRSEFARQWTATGEAYSYFELVYTTFKLHHLERSGLLANTDNI